MSSSTRLRYALCFFSAAVSFAAIIGACSSDRESVEPPPGKLEPPIDANTPDLACGVHCSRDLKAVMTGCDGDEHLVQPCNADQGCGQGQCVPACEAARLSKGAVGCDFLTIAADAVSDGRGSCFAAMVSNTWDREVTLSAEYGNSPLDISQSVYTVSSQAGGPTYTRLVGPLPKGQVAIVFWSALPEPIDKYTILCPDSVTPAIRRDAMAHGTTRTSAFRLMTDVPVTTYSIFPYGGAKSYMPTATLLLPVSSWEKDYVAVSPNAFGHPSERTLQIIASQDDTVVSMRPNTEVPIGNDVEGATAGLTQSWKLSRGEVLQFTQSTLTGSPISATKPVGMFGGSRCTYLPGEATACDMLQQQIPAPSQWGTEYAFVPYPSRASDPSNSLPEFVFYTIVSLADGTELTYEPSRPRSAPERLDAGQSASFKSNERLLVRSQDSKHPFYAAVYMSGQDFGGGLGGAPFKTGDPDFVNLPATDQFLDKYVFFADYTYPDTGLTIVRRKTPQGFRPVELACAGEIQGFQPLGTSGKLEYAWVSLTKDAKSVNYAKGECGYGRQEARSEGPFSVHVWGVGDYASYGYVAGTGLRPINDVPPTILR